MQLIIIFLGRSEIYCYLPCCWKALHQTLKVVQNGFETNLFFKKFYSFSKSLEILFSRMYFARWSYVSTSAVVCCEYLGSFLVLLMAAERYILICLPHKSEQLLSQTRRKLIICITLIIVFVSIGLICFDASTNHEIVRSNCYIKQVFISFRTEG